MYPYRGKRLIRKPGNTEVLEVFAFVYTVVSECYDSPVYLTCTAANNVDGM